MKALHVPFCFFPDTVGGTEVYVARLASALEEQHVASVVVAPGTSSNAYRHDGIPVYRIRVENAVADIRELYGAGDQHAAREFATILDCEQPDVVHLHAFTRGASLRLVDEAVDRGIPVVFTYHTATVSCSRGSLRQWDEHTCTGEMITSRCVSCALHGLGVSRPIARMLGRFPDAVGQTVRSLNWSGGPWTALRMGELTQLRHDTVRRLMRTVKRIVVFCSWTRDVLLRNGVPSESISVVRHGIENRGRRGMAPIRRDGPLTLVSLGRCSREKGFDVLIRAVRGLPAADVRLDVYVVKQHEHDTVYERELCELAGDDPRIRVLPSVPVGTVVDALSEYDAVAVPSRVLETGPLVVLEAFAAGVPVIGSNLGGIAESVRDNVDGMLVASDSVHAWRHVIQRALNRELLSSLRAGITQPRSMRDVAADVAAIYQSCLASS